MNRGIDYGMGQTNIDMETGIRFGVIPSHDILQAWSDSSESDYGPASCGKCGNEAVEIGEVPFDLDEAKTIRQDGWCRKHDVLRIPKSQRKACGDKSEWHDEGRDFACLSCARSFDSEDAYGEEPLRWTLDDGEYKATQGQDDCDVFVLKSPYYTYGPFCSPCAPGAVYLRNGSTEGVKAYCFAPDWFDWWAEMGVEWSGVYEGRKTSCPYPVYRVEDDVCVFMPE